MIKYVIVIGVFLNISVCLGQESYGRIYSMFEKQIPSKYYLERDSLVKEARPILDFLPPGFSMRGDVDYTSQIQKAIDNAGVWLMPNFPVLINSSGLNIPSNTVLVFQEGAKVIVKSNSETHYGAINIREANSVKIYFANIEGDRDRHLIKKGEWGMGIRVLGSSNIALYVPKIHNSWGDGIYIGAIGEKYSEKISILHPNIERSRRNGISITAGNDIILRGGLISNTFGTAPQSAVDIEPNSPKAIVNNVEIYNLITYKSAGDGIMIDLSNLTLKHGRASKLPSIGETNIIIRNHKDFESFSAARINGRIEDKTKERYVNGKIKGAILFQNPVWSGNAVPIRFSPKPERVVEHGFYPPVSINNALIVDSTGKPIRRQKQTLKNIQEQLKGL